MFFTGEILIFLLVLDHYEKKIQNQKSKPIVKVGKLTLTPYGDRTAFFLTHFKVRYPCLSKIAHLVLQLPSSSAGIERTFSLISKQFDPHRSKITLLRLVQVQEHKQFIEILKSISAS